MNEFVVSESEFGSKPEDVLAFRQAIENVKKHNKQFSMGKIMAKAMIVRAETAKRAEDLIQLGATDTEAEQFADFTGSDRVPYSEEEKLARLIVDFESGSLFTMAGLTVSSSQKDGVKYGVEGNESIGKVYPQLSNGGNFANFLLNINPEAVDATFQEDITYVMDIIVGGIKDAVVNDTDEQSRSSAAEALAYAKSIQRGLEHVGLAKSDVAQELDVLCKHAEQGDLQEFIEADTLQLMKMPEEQGFGPATWQKDASSEFLSSRWSNILDVLKSAKENPKARDLFLQLVTSARESLDYAKNDWLELRAKNYGSNGYGQDFEKIFETIDLELSMITPFYDDRSPQ